MGKQFALDGKDSLKMVCEFPHLLLPHFPPKRVYTHNSTTSTVTYNATQNGYDQQLFHNGALKSQITANTGKTKSFYTDVECQGTHTGTINAHKYTDTKIVLSEPDPNWGRAPSNHMLACATKISTPDGGKTWVIPAIKVSESQATKDYEGKNKAGPILCAAGGE